jgi:putative nucleotidyltransferase with HDIG domain
MNLVDELARLPAQPVAALQLLRLLDDPDGSAAQLAAVIDLDPSLSARVLQMANSRHRGVGGTITSATRAVVLLGVPTVKGVAAAAAGRLLGDESDLGPRDYWAHSVTTAGVASVLARRVGANPSDAFTAGLLHDVGLALMHGADRRAYDEVIGRRLGPEAERGAFGMTHAEAGAAALRAWHLPEPLIRAVADHHRPPGRRSYLLTQVVIAADALADTVEPLALHEERWPVETALRALSIDPSELPTLMGEVGRELDRTTRVIGAA